MSSIHPLITMIFDRKLRELRKFVGALSILVEESGNKYEPKSTVQIHSTP